MFSSPAADSHDLAEGIFHVTPRVLLSDSSPGREVKTPATAKAARGLSSSTLELSRFY